MKNDVAHNRKNNKRKNNKYISYKEKPDYQSMNKRWDALFLQVLTAIQNGAAVVITTIFTNLTTVSVYSIYNMVMHGVNGVLQIFTTGLSASFGDVIARKEENTLKKSYREFEFFLLFYHYSCFILYLWLCCYHL